MLLCSIFRSKSQEGMYLYVEKRVGLTEVPAELLRRFGKTELAMTMMLAADKKLARADAGAVLAAIAENGYYLQLPPHHDSEMAQLSEHNSKLAR